MKCRGSVLPVENVSANVGSHLRRRERVPELQNSRDATRAMNATYSKIGGTTVCEGPCVVCGMRDYPLSMGGPNICPACDAGIDPNDKRHPRNQMKVDSAEALKQPVLMPGARDELILAALEACLRELQQANAYSAQLTLLLGQVINRLDKPIPGKIL